MVLPSAHHALPTRTRQTHGRSLPDADAQGEEVRSRQVVDRTSEGWYVAAAYGNNADWFRNIKANPNVTVDYKGRSTAATAAVTSEPDGAEVLRRYARTHPRAARTLGRLMNVPMEGNMTEAAHTIPIVKLVG